MFNIIVTAYNLNGLISARKQEIVKITEQLIESINNADFEGYTYV